MTADWEREAERWGIERGYFDIRGRYHTTPPETVAKIISALSASGDPAAWPQPPDQPNPAYQGDGRRHWIVAVQLYSLRSRRNWGIGDFTDLLALIEAVAAEGAAGIGLNPLHALFSERPDDASPYAPNSRLFLNPLYIDVEAIPGFPRDYVRNVVGKLDALRNAELIDYRAVAELKWPALREACQTFIREGGADVRAEFERFCRERAPALQHFAAFETLRRKLQAAWPDWPREWRGPGDEVFKRLQQEDGDELEFHQFVQWIADRQLQACSALAKSRGMTVGLYIDLAVGVDTAGADAWIAQDGMLRDLSVGAPPDEYNTAGQNWGLASFDPHGLVRQNFAPLREMLRAAMRHAGAIRIDHVLGLMRIFVILHGSKASEGAYIRFPFASLLSVIAEESRQHRCIVIGEDLGTVPEGFRDTMYAWGLWSYLVMLFEREWGGAFKPPQHYREAALATFGTHDLPTFLGWMSGHDLVAKRAIGVDPGEGDEDRERSRAALRRAVGDREEFLPVVEFLAATPTRLVSIAIEDVLGLRDQVNVPGTVREHPNWRRRLSVDVEALRDDQRLREIAAVFRRSGRAGA